MYRTVKFYNRKPKEVEKWISLRAAIRPPYNYSAWPDYPGVGETACKDCKIDKNNYLAYPEKCPCKQYPSLGVK